MAGGRCLINSLLIFSVIRSWIPQNCKHHALSFGVTKWVGEYCGSRRWQWSSLMVWMHIRWHDYCRYRHPFIWFWCLHGERWKGKEKQSEKASRAQSSWWVSPERRASQITCHELLKAWLVTNNESCKTINGKKHQIVSVPSEDVSPYVLCSRLAGLNLDPHHVASI